MQLYRICNICALSCHNASSESHTGPWGDSAGRSKGGKKKRIKAKSLRWEERLLGDLRGATVVTSWNTSKQEKILGFSTGTGTHNRIRHVFFTLLKLSWAHWPLFNTKRKINDCMVTQLNLFYIGKKTKMYNFIQQLLFSFYIEFHLVKPVVYVTFVHNCHAIWKRLLWEPFCVYLFIYYPFSLTSTARR